ncbi:Alcohol dehydrogenase-like [Arachis hypogaea]|nr:Alcohol dehydrogenase-like [Arachis hypogaea]
MSLMEGLGAAWNVANVTKGSTGVIFGLGIIGLSVAQGTKLRGASRIIGVDKNPHKCEKGVLPPFVPFAQAFAAVLTAVLTGSLYYVATSLKDPTYVVAPVLQSRSGCQDLKKLFEAWYEKRQMKKIYSPLLEGLLALYLGFEWIQTNNILAPIITHGIYSTVILRHGLWKIHDHRHRLRQRIQQLKSEERYSK